MSDRKKYYLPIDGEKVPVTKEVFKAHQHYERKEEYFSVDLKREGFIADQEAQTVTFIPSREDSLERLIDLDVQFPAVDEVSPEDAAIKAVMLERLRNAILTLTDSEWALVYELFYLERSVREPSADLDITRSTVQNRKKEILLKLPDMI